MDDIQLKKLLSAIRSCQLENVKKVLESCKFEWRTPLNPSKDSILHLAIRSSQFDLVRYIIDQSGDLYLEIQNAHCKRPIHESALVGRADITELLLQKGVQIDAIKQADWTPLMLASSKGYLPVVKLLIQWGANVTRTNKDGWTPLHLASRNSNPELIDYLLNQNCDILMVSSTNGRYPLHTAALHGCEENVEKLINRGFYQGNEIDNCGNTPVMDAARSGSLETLQKVLWLPKSSVETYDKMGRNVLHLATECGYCNIIAYLVNEKLMNINSETLDGQTCLHFAARSCDVCVLELLVKFGISLDHVDKRHRNALWMASTYKNDKFYDALLMNGAKL